jgi:hypothetical protein
MKHIFVPFCKKILKDDGRRDKILSKRSKPHSNITPFWKKIILFLQFYGNVFRNRAAQRGEGKDFGVRSGKNRKKSIKIYKTIASIYQYPTQNGIVFG